MGSLKVAGSAGLSAVTVSDAGSASEATADVASTGSLNEAGCSAGVSVSAVFADSESTGGVVSSAGVSAGSTTWG